MGSLILTVALLLGSHEPPREADAWFTSPAETTASQVRRGVSQKQPGGVLSFGILDDYVDGDARVTLLRLLVPQSCDTPMEWYRIGLGLEDVPDVREVVWKR